ncbi:MAG TPA: SCO family protein [Bryobacteraceae bacterium]|nr:SCO family protein [Bryobacteraceae bacterium]
MRTAHAAALACLALAGLGCRRGPALPTYNIVPDFELTDQTGRTFRSRDRLNGHVWVANFMFTTCMGPCPRMSSQLKRIRDATADFPGRRLVSFTIDPRRDTPDVLAQYGRRFGADPASWALLTGPQNELHNLSRNVFMLGDVDGRLEHSTRFVLIDRESRVRNYYDSSDPGSIRQLIADMRALARS